jgi:hypothetical protein
MNVDINDRARTQRLSLKLNKSTERYCQHENLECYSRMLVDEVTKICINSNRSTSRVVLKRANRIREHILRIDYQYLMGYMI